MARAELEAQTDRALGALAGLGIAPTRWRTPWGDRAPWTGEVAAERGLALVGWTADTHDWRGDDPGGDARPLAEDLAAGDVVLMHDGVGPRRAPRSLPRDGRPARPAGRDGRRPRLTPGLPRGGGRVDPLRVIAAGAGARDRAEPAFPEEPMRLLEDAGALAATLPRDDGSRPSAGEEWSLPRAVAAADGSVARILDGHLNGVNRICALAPEPLRRAEIAAVAGRARRIGVWGADPGPDEGPPRPWWTDTSRE